MEYPGASEEPPQCAGGLEIEALQRLFEMGGRQSWPSRNRKAVALVVAAALLAALALLWVARPAGAQTPRHPEYEMLMAQLLSCAPAAKVLKRTEFAAELDSTYDERRVATMYLSPFAIVELYVSTDRGTYTILRSNPHGQACIAHAGRFSFQPQETAL